jgi:hypothetical protein
METAILDAENRGEAMQGTSRRDVMPANDAASSPVTPPAEVERSATRKVQTRIIPFVFVLFAIAFIDRINIGFAALSLEDAAVQY